MIPTAPAIAPRRLQLVMALVSGALFMEILDGTIIVTALPSMARAFGTTAVALNVGISAYLLALGVFIPASGWVADRLGTRRVFATAIALFTISSALCGTTTSAGMFVALRVAQGMAGAMMVPVGRLLVMRFTPRDRLMIALTTLTWPALIAPVLGPPIGGFITTHLGWRWIFFLNVPIGIIALVAALALVPDARGEGRRRFDWAGFLLGGVGTSLLLVGFDRIAERPDAAAIGLIAAGLAALTATMRHLKRAVAPLLDISAYAIPTFRASLRGGSLTRMAIGAAPFLLPLMFQVGFGYDAFHAGLLVLALFSGNLAMKTLTTRTLRRFGYRRVLIVNGLFAAASLAACAFLTRETPIAIVLVLLFAGGVTRSMQFTTLSTLAFADVPRARMGDANGLFNTTSQLTHAAGITFAALAVRAVHPVAGPLGIVGAGADYRAAFLLLAAVALLGLIEFARLAPDAGNAFVGRGH